MLVPLSLGEDIRLDVEADGEPTVVVGAPQVLALAERLATAVHPARHAIPLYAPDASSYAVVSLKFGGQRHMAKLLPVFVRAGHRGLGTDGSISSVDDAPYTGSTPPS